MPWWFSAFTNPGQRPTAWRHRRPVPWTKTGSLPHRAGPWVYPDGDTVGPWKLGRRLRQCVPCCWCIQTDKLPTPFLSRRLSRFPPRRAFGFGFGFGLGFDFGFGLDWIRRRLGFRCRFDTIPLCFVKLRGKIFQLLTRSFGGRGRVYFPAGAADLIFAPLGEGTVEFSLHPVGDDESQLLQPFHPLGHLVLGDPGVDAEKAVSDDIRRRKIPAVVIAAQNQPDQQGLLEPVQLPHLTAGQNRIPDHSIGHRRILLFRASPAPG